MRGGRTRPTGDRVRESLFDILGPSVVGSRFLDLFAGTGSVGIEALSRGADVAVFVESSKAAAQTLRRNLDDLGFRRGADDGERRAAVVLPHDVFAAIERAVERFGPFDIVFVDPPYAHEWGARSLTALSRSGDCLAPAARVVLQHGKREAVAGAYGKLRRFRSEAYGETTLSFYEWNRGE